MLLQNIIAHFDYSFKNFGNPSSKQSNCQCNVVSTFAKARPMSCASVFSFSNVGAASTKANIALCKICTSCVNFSSFVICFLVFSELNVWVLVSFTHKVQYASTSCFLVAVFGNLSFKYFD